jgi:hypothetical protein
VVDKIHSSRRTWASSKASRNVFSDSPDIPDTIEGADMQMNGTPSSYRSVITHINVSKKNCHHGKALTPAIAWASSVLPHPGGPCNNTPLGGCTPVCMYTSGWQMGIATSSSIFSTHGCTPPISDNRASGGERFSLRPELVPLDGLCRLELVSVVRDFRFPFDAAGWSSKPERPLDAESVALG